MLGESDEAADEPRARRAPVGRPRPPALPRAHAPPRRADRARRRRGREKPYRPVAKHFVVGPEIRATGLASDLQGAQLRELQRGFDLFAAAGEFRSAQLHAKLDIETVRKLLNELVDKLAELEDESKPPLSITVAFHPLITQGETD